MTVRRNRASSAPIISPSQARRLRISKGRLNTHWRVRALGQDLASQPGGGVHQPPSIQLGQKNRRLHEKRRRGSRRSPQDLKDTYFWRVEASNGINETPYSETASFVIIPTFDTWVVVLLALVMSAYAVRRCRG